MATAALLGPQRLHPMVKSTLDELGVEGPVAMITAGWEEREAEAEELSEHLGCETVNLRLYGRVEETFAEDPEFHQAMIQRHDSLRDLQRLYRIRLHHALEAARELFARDDDPALLLPERADAMAAVAALDEHHLSRVREVHAEFADRWRPDSRESLASRREQVHTELEGCGGVVVAGGHVVVLLNRLRLFDIKASLSRLPTVAWSAGAMALTQRVVVFHDSPPQGFGNPEVLETGLGLCPEVVALPDARRRLQLKDPVRVAVFARRFAPAECMALDENCRADWDGREWRAWGRTRKLDPSGTVSKAAAP